MAMFLSEERAPLEMTKSSKHTILVVCPVCKSSRNLSENSFGFICVSCKNYISKSNFIYDANEAEFSANRNIILSDEYLEMRKKVEINAYEYRDKQIAAKQQKIKGA